MTLMKNLEDKIRGEALRVIFPEGEDERILPAVQYLCENDLAHPIILFASEDSLAGAKGFPSETQLINILDQEQVDRWVARFLEKSDAMSEKRLRRKFKTPLDAGAIMLAAGGANAMVAGLSCATEEVILSSIACIGLQDDISIPSSIFLMNIPGFKGSEGELMIFADCGVNPAPDSTELAEIALSTSRTAIDLLGWEPRIAFLSFSTDGSAQHDIVEKVIEGTNKAKEKMPNVKIDGEFQLDAAIVPDVAAKKVKRPSDVAGAANILIFPDLNAGNIAYKAVQRFAKAYAYGPFLQGFKKSVSDLSRGSSVDDVIGVSVMALARAKGQQKD